jgi:uncharacterized membrane protein YraQ (UPF0718 family)
LAFLITTPESGVDSIALTYSLLDPLLTVLRPVTAFVTGFTAGLTENLTGSSYKANREFKRDRSCHIDSCCDGIDCDPETHSKHHTFREKLRAGMSFSFNELMNDVAFWFVIGVLIAGTITVFVPDSLIQGYLGAGILSYLAVLGVSLPMYVCATVSTPVAAALIAKGMSPGAAIVLLMAGPATNAATITMVAAMLGKRTLAIYLGSIIVCTLMFAFITDLIYSAFSIPAPMKIGPNAQELLPAWLELSAAFALLFLILRVYWKKLTNSSVYTAISSWRLRGAKQPCECRGDT